MENNAIESFKSAIEDLKRVIELESKVIELESKFAFYRNGLGSNATSKECDATIVDCDRAIQLDPKNYIAYLIRGILKASLNRHDDAIADYDKAIKLGPENLMGYQNYLHRGNSHEALKRHDDAIADYDKAIEMNPNNSTAYFRRGISKASLNRHDDAIADYDKAIEMNPNNSTTYFGRGISKASLKRHDDAITDYNRAITLGLKVSILHCHRGSSNMSLKKFGAALEDFSQAIKLDPKDPIAYFYRGTLYQLTNEKSKALDDFLETIPMTRDDPPGSLYKYIPIKEHHLLSLINNEVYFALPTQFNDPLECFFLNKVGNIGACFDQHNIKPRICSMVKESPSSESSNSILMFAHYANDHKGICVEYEFDIKKLRENNCVAYGGARYEEKTNFTDLKDLYMLKDPAWKYEKEFRFVRFDNKEYIEAKVKSITFGLKCPKEHREIVRSLLPDEVKYHEMKHEDESNLLIRSKINSPDKKTCTADVIKLMLNEGLTCL